MREFENIQDKVRDLLLDKLGFEELEDGFLTKKLTTTEEFDFCPLAIIYGFFRGMGDKQEYYKAIVSAYSYFGLEPQIRQLKFTKSEQAWLDQTNDKNEVYNWDRLIAWLDGEMNIFVDTAAADIYYDEKYKDWEEG